MTQPVEFAIEQEAWNVYQLDDGGRVKVRVLLTGVRRRDELGPNGQPVYECDIQSLICTENYSATTAAPSRSEHKD